ncbi:aminotransferase class V-fold PLP-dependent enzyme [bacterium]|nr:aminotransferase class V-fold PLP-dependent enzyme [bacterium]
MLKSHRGAIERFFAAKALGEPGREKFDATYRSCIKKATELLGGNPDNYALLSSSSEGINLLLYALDWDQGDNVVVADVEFPSDVLPWTVLENRGVETRIVRNQNWRIRIEDIAAQIDPKTRVVAISHVSYFTGQKLPLAELSELVRSKGALLLIDATHSAGVTPVEAEHADILVASCYKWLLATHGVAIFYWNRERLPHLKPPFLGWNSGVTIPDWQTPTSFNLPDTADRFVPGNPSFLGGYVLENALNAILDIGVSAIEEHNLRLAGQVWNGLHDLDLEVMTPEPRDERAGNVCFMAPNVESITTELANRNIVIWGSYAGVERVRVSTHLYNSEEDVASLLSALREMRV